MHDTINSAQPAGEESDDAPPGRERRLALVRALQTRALRQEDPLAANLGMMAADLSYVVHGLAPAVQARLSEWTATAEGRQRFVQEAELYLKFVRQVDRLAQLERQLSQPSTREARGG